MADGLITCLNCYWKGDDLEQYHRHNLEHEVDKGVTFGPRRPGEVAADGGGPR